MIDIVQYIESQSAPGKITGGRWVLSRPSSQILLSRRDRLRDAMAVFRGQADAVVWGKPPPKK